MCVCLKAAAGGGGNVTSHLKSEEITSGLYHLLTISFYCMYGPAIMSQKGKQGPKPDMESWRTWAKLASRTQIQSDKQEFEKIKTELKWKLQSYDLFITFVLSFQRVLGGVNGLFLFIPTTVLRGRLDKGHPLSSWLSRDLKIGWVFLTQTTFYPLCQTCFWTLQLLVYFVLGQKCCFCIGICSCREGNVCVYTQYKQGIYNIICQSGFNWSFWYAFVPRFLSNCVFSDTLSHCWGSCIF